MFIGRQPVSCAKIDFLLNSPQSSFIFNSLTQKSASTMNCSAGSVSYHTIELNIIIGAFLYLKHILVSFKPTNISNFHFLDNFCVALAHYIAQYASIQIFNIFKFSFHYYVDSLCDCLLVINKYACPLYCRHGGQFKVVTITLTRANFFVPLQRVSLMQ